VNPVIEGHVTQADKQRGGYVYVPFDLAEPASRLTVCDSYSAPISSDKRERRNVIDISTSDRSEQAKWPGHNLRGRECGH
jgi:hypothetical protein